MKFIIGLTLMVLAFMVSEPQVVTADGGYGKAGEYCKHPEGHDKSKCKKEHRGGGYGDGAGYHNKGDFCEKIKEELDLTDDQEASVDRIKSECRKDGISIRAEIEVLEVELKDMTNSSRTDLKKVKKKLGEIESKKSELRFLHIEKRTKIRAILNDEQKEKYDDLVEEFGDKHHGGYDKKKCSKKN